MDNKPVSALLSRLSTFRPSDRIELKNALASPQGRDDAIRAVKKFVQGWEKSDWLEAYSIERIGKWIARNAGDDVIDELRIWGQRKKTDARQALLNGLNEMAEA